MHMWWFGDNLLVDHFHVRTPDHNKSLFFRHVREEEVSDCSDGQRGNTINKTRTFFPSSWSIRPYTLSAIFVGAVVFVFYLVVIAAMGYLKPPEPGPHSPTCLLVSRLST